MAMEDRDEIKNKSKARSYEDLAVTKTKANSREDPRRDPDENKA